MASSSKRKEVLSTGKDRDVITAPPGGKTMGYKCGNPECYVRAIEVPLKACAKCKTIRYCSRECQAAHWKRHKVWCNHNTDHAQSLAKADAEANAFGFAWNIPDGVTLVDLDQKLEKWVKFHSNLLMAATIHALSLPRDIKRAKMFFLRVKVSYRPDHKDMPSKFFRVNDAFLIDIEEAKKLGSVWTASIEHVDTMRAESEALRRGSVAAIVPFGSLKDLSPLKIQNNWKEILIRDVERGKKLMRFEMAD
ncbi:hypothetical protein M413DRAFT_448743 [Hebeloma cylindrosporum]|uniref:MYND-type domain-containing protein n=1 Tax=Hebeloma cylindrosporum TaxID=76867 RepID=A0A0C2XGI0_HEBCY|nr:hypothetical protein M413DRAFT_448743 [Hebeloma cylindrosporum h7]